MSTDERFRADQLSDDDLAALRTLIKANLAVPSFLVARLLADRDAWMERAFAAAETGDP